MSFQPSPSAPLRDFDELEGTLLLPHATAVVDESSSNFQVAAAAAAVPVDSFNYSSSNRTAAAIVVSEEDEKEIQDTPEAPLVPLYGDSQLSREQKEKNALEMAKRRGLQAAEAEKEAIRRAGRDIFAMDYHTAQKTKEANDVARLQARTRGVQVEEDKWFGRSNPVAKPAEKPKPSFSNKYGGGYEVAEYDTSDYDTKDYQVSEYRSVYDQVA